ncbi:unnamed protein product [Caretta caretta]
MCAEASAAPGPCLRPRGEGKGRVRGPGSAQRSCLSSAPGDPAQVWSDGFSNTISPPRLQGQNPGKVTVTLYLFRQIVSEADDFLLNAAKIALANLSPLRH